MPMEACRLMRDGENLLTIALTLHMSSMGSSDPISEKRNYGSSESSIQRLIIGAMAVITQETSMML